VQGVAERDLGGQRPHEPEEDQGDPADHDQDLDLLGLADGAGAAGDGIKDDEPTRGDDGEVQGPAQHRRQDDGGGVERDSGRQATLDEEEESRQLPGLEVETLLEKLVRRDHPESVIPGHHHHGQNHHGQRQAKVELHETKPIFVGLARRGQEGDGAGLRGHDG
jgi:hypothetical protein